eukprot:2794450-Prymnesium_polylepis.1
MPLPPLARRARRDDLQRVCLLLEAVDNQGVAQCAQEVGRSWPPPLRDAERAAGRRFPAHSS